MNDERGRRGLPPSVPSWCFDGEPKRNPPRERKRTEPNPQPKRTTKPKAPKPPKSARKS